MELTTEHIDQILNAIESNDQVAFNKVVDSVINDKIKNQLEDRKIKLTGEIFNNPSK